MMPRSKLFRSTDSGNPDAADFFRAAGVFSKLDEQTARGLLDGLPETQGAPTRTHRQKIIAEQLETLKVDRATAGLAVEGFLSPLVTAWEDPELADDEPSAIVEDLVDRKAVEPTHAPKLVRLLCHLKTSVAPKLRAIAKTRQVAAGVLPSLSGVGVTVELRAIMEPEFDGTTSASGYAPRIVDLLPIASIRILTDVRRHDFHFQSDLNGLDVLIARLEAAKKELSALAAISRKLDAGNTRGPNEPPPS